MSENANKNNKKPSDKPSGGHSRRFMSGRGKSDRAKGSGEFRIGSRDILATPEILSPFFTEDTQDSAQGNKKGNNKKTNKRTDTNLTKSVKPGKGKQQSTPEVTLTEKPAAPVPNRK